MSARRPPLPSIIPARIRVRVPALVRALPPVGLPTPLPPTVPAARRPPRGARPGGRTLSTAPRRKKEPPRRIPAPVSVVTRKPAAPLEPRRRTGEPKGGIPIPQDPPESPFDPPFRLFSGGGEPAAATQYGLERRVSTQEETPEEWKDFVIHSVNISVFSFQEMQRIAGNVKIVDPKGEGRGSINDPRLGTYKALTACGSCGEITCPGHYGLIELARPVANPVFLDFICKILTCVCNTCGRLFLSRDLMESLGFAHLRGAARLKAVSSYCKNVSCPRRAEEAPREGEGPLLECASNPIFYPSYSKKNGYISYKNDSQEPGEGHMMPPETVWDVLSRISEEEVRLLGLNPEETHPRDLVLKGLLVLPLNTRPPVVQGAKIIPNQLSEAYNKIIRINEDLKSQMDPTRRRKEEASQEKKDQTYLKLVGAIRELMIGSDSKTHANRPIVSLEEQIRGKKKMLRGLMGKRTDYCGRTVLGPDASLRFGQIRIPEALTHKLTVRVDVFPFNVEAVRQMLREGKLRYIIHRDGFRVEVFKNRKYKIQSGMTVERKLQNGDIIVFNRQPTLHKYSMMAYEAVIGKPLTIGLHLSVTTAHNADFDGDEGNLWALRSLESQAEAQEILDVRKCIISSQTNRPIIGLVMDTISGLHVLTRDRPAIFFTDAEFFSLLDVMTGTVYLPSLESRLKKYGVHPRSGKAIFSALLPEDFYYRKGAVEIVDGILISGTIQNTHIGTSDRSIVQELVKEYGADRAAQFLTDAPFVATQFLNEQGLTVGIEDCAPEDPELKKKIRRTLAETQLRVEALTSATITSEVEKAHREAQVVGIVDIAKASGLQLAKEALAEENSLKIMAKEIGGGAKGDPYNVNQMAAFLGQQYVFGERFKPQLTEGTRTLCVFEENSKALEARGFCVHSFREGLDPPEFYFHAGASRLGLLDTAIKTSEVGDMHRHMVKALENLLLQYDGSVRDAFGHIIQYIYGNDGLEASRLVSVPTLTTQNLATFMDVEMTAARLNVRRGWIPRKSAETIRLQRRRLRRSLTPRSSVSGK